MNKIKSMLWSAALITLVACGGTDSGLEGKKAELKEYRKEFKELKSKISTLEEEIAAEDPSALDRDKATLVTTEPVPTKTFRHFLEVRGSVTSDRNVSISAEAPAMIQRVLVQEGERVKKGQVLIRQDAETSRRGLEELQTSLELATIRFERQKKLWDQKIGTEIQFLEAKNAKETLDRRIASSRSQLANYTVRAPFSGTIDRVFIKEGEMAQPGAPLIRLVSLQDMFIESDVSESYIGEFQVGDTVEITFPSLKQSLTSTISSIGEVIDQNNRTFSMEVKLPGDAKLLRPNLLAVLRIEDFHEPSAVVVPTNLILSDNRGDYVYVATEQDGQLTAVKKPVERGMTYNNETMITSGLSGNEQLIKEGFREVAEGMRIKEAENGALSSNQ
ncbi:MAG: efflux RND transporter periplasmic adaptor subunit [Tunicatimonas sp.]